MPNITAGLPAQVKNCTHWDSLHSPHVFDAYFMLDTLFFLDQVRTLRWWFNIKAVVFLWTVMWRCVLSLSLPSWSLGFFHISWVGLKLFTHFMTLEKCFCILGFHSWMLQTLHFPHFLWDASEKHALFSFYQFDVQVSRPLVGSALRHVYMPLEGSNPALARHLQPVLILEPHTGLLHSQFVSRELCKYVS